MISFALSANLLTILLSRLHSQVFKLVIVACILVSPVAETADTVTETTPTLLKLLPKSYAQERVAVDARLSPWSAIGRITLFDHPLRPGGRTFCSGTLISENVVLTAAHCVWSRRNFPDEIRFVAGAQRDSYVAYSKGKRIAFSDAYTPSENTPEEWGNDWALIELEKPIGEKAGFIGLADFDFDMFESLKAKQITYKLSGYRGDRSFIQTVDPDCNIDGFVLNNTLIQHHCPLFGGDSGGPIFISSEDKNLIIGIDAGVRGKKDSALEQVR